MNKRKAKVKNKRPDEQIEAPIRFISIKITTMQQILTPQETATLLAVLKNRFEKHPHRHPAMAWAAICSKLENNADKLRAIHAMEQTGGEPDVIKYDAETDRYFFTDCSPESPTERRSLCYDRQALNARKANKPTNSAMDLAAAMGVELLTEEQYRALQQLGNFDQKTSSWVKTPPAIRELGGALFCDKRYNHVFLYHNGADSYYAARGFRGGVWV